MYAPTIFFIKLSILLQYVEIFVPGQTKTGTYWACHAIIWLNFIYYTISLFLEIFPCSPIAKAWDPLIVEGACLNTRVINMASAGINAVSDIVILVLPQVVIWRLQMSFSKKVGVSAVFFVGVL